MYIPYHLGTYKSATLCKTEIKYKLRSTTFFADHELKHRRLRHARTSNKETREKQLLKAVRGRPSLKESFVKQGEIIINDDSIKTRKTESEST